MRSGEIKMIRRKKSIVALAMVCSLLVTGCQLGGNSKEGLENTKFTDPTEKLQVVTTIFPYYDFARQVAGDYADVTMIVPAGMDTHSFEPTAEDMVTIGKADVLIYNGGELEGWVPQVIEAAGNRNLFVDAMIDYVDVDGDIDVEDANENSVAEKLEERIDDAEDRREDRLEAEWDRENDLDDSLEHYDEDGHIHEHSHAHDDGDEHIWTSPENAKEIVEQIAKDLGKKDQEHKQEYIKNAEKYITELDRIDQELENVTERARNPYLVFADRFPLRHFVDEYDLDYIAAFAGCGSETEPSVETIAKITDIVRERQIPVILKIELSSSKVAESIAEATGAEVRTFSTCHNVTKKEMEEGVTYVSLMEQNISVLKEALEVE